MKQDKCCMCGAIENLEHHHVIPKSDGGTDDLENIITLCSNHHAAIHGICLTKSRKRWGKNTIQKGLYLNSHVEHGPNGKFQKKNQIKFPKLIYLSEDEWNFIDIEKKKNKSGRGAFISKILRRYIDGT